MTTRRTNQDWAIKIVTFSISKYHKSMLLLKILVKRSDEYDGLVLFQEQAACYMEA
jgi:hypothetical protein